MSRTEGRSDRESFPGELVRESERAYLFKPDHGDVGAIWLPMSQCTWVPDSGEARGNGGWMMIPQWLCEKHGLSK